MDKIMTKLVIVLIIFGACFAKQMLTMDPDDIKETMKRIAYKNAKYFAEDPRRLEKLTKKDPSFAGSKFGVCLNREFGLIPGIDDKPSLCHRLGFALGLKPARVRDLTYLQAVHAGVKCSELVAHITKKAK